MTKYSIYVITNIVNSKQYVGITKRLKRRWKEHQMCIGGCSALYFAFEKYGIDSFVFTHIADAFDKENACFLEKMFILEKNTISPNGYNLTSGGDGGFELSKESKEKMSAAKKGKIAKNKGIKLSKETIEKISASKKGKPWTEEQRKKIMAGRVGDKRSSFGMKGKKHSEETKQKMKISQQARFKAINAIKKASEVMS